MILWISTAISFGSHLSEESDGTRLTTGLALVVGLAVWLHGIHRIHRWDGRMPVWRTVAMLLGVYVVLGAQLSLSSVYFAMLFGVFSVTFAFCDRVPVAVGLSLIVTVLWTWAWLFWGLPTGGVLTPWLVWGLINVINLFVTRVSDQADEQARLIDELEATRAQLAVAERQRGTLDERQRLAAEIHDTLAQGFTSIVVLSQATRMQGDAPDSVDRSLGLIEDTARSNLNEARRLVDALRPASLDGRSLTDALAAAAERVAQRTGATTSIESSGDDSALGGDLDVVLLRVAQEALANIEKHAGASHIALQLDITNDAVVLSIEDDGSGFDPDGPRPLADPSSGGHGLGLMAERLDAVGGTVSVKPAPGRGTTVRAEIPLP